MNTCLRFPGGRSRALTLSYDDGVTSDIRFKEIIDAQGIRATFNINTGVFHEGEEPLPTLESREFRRMTKKEAYELYANSPHEIAAHALTHPWLDQLPIALVTHEVMEDRKNIEEMFGTVCRGMAYPYGATSDDVIRALEACDIAYARTVVSTGSFALPTNWLRLPATCHHNDKRLPDLCNTFLQNTTAGKPPRLFYLWGHTYEFCSNDNWHVIEEFAKRMGGHEDIWYATNIEICDYVHAFRQMHFSADGKRVYNPTATELCFAPDMRSDACITVPAGATVAL